MSKAELPRVSDAIQQRMIAAFQDAAVRTSMAPTMCTRSLVSKIADQASDNVIMTFGGAAFAGADPAGDGADEVIALAPISIVMPRTPAINLLVALGQALGGEVKIAEGGKLTVEQISG